MRTIPSLLVVVLGVCCCSVTCSVSYAATAEVCGDPALTIPDGGAPDMVAIDSLYLGTNVAIEEVKVTIDVSHTFIGDLQIGVVSPAGTAVQLYDGAGGDEDDIDVIFSGTGAGYDSESWVCACEVMPSGPGALSDFNGEESAGTWSLGLGDFTTEDGGTLNHWCVNVEGCQIFPPVEMTWGYEGSSVVIYWTEFDPVPVLMWLYKDGELYATMSGPYVGFFEGPLPAGLYVYELVVGDFDGCSSLAGRIVVEVGLNEFCTAGPAGNTINFESDPVTSTLEITEDITPVEIAVSVDISHTWDGDLQIVVESPDAVSVTLFDKAFGSPDTEEDDMALVYADHGAPHASVPLTCGCFMEPVVAGSMSDLVGESATGTWTLTVTDTFADDDGVLNSWCVRTYAEPDKGPVFVRGDVDGNGHFSGIADSLYLLRYAFSSGTIPPCLEAADADANGSVNGLVDALRMLNHAFLGGADLAAPYPDCGTAEILISCDVEPDCS